MTINVGTAPVIKEYPALTRFLQVVKNALETDRVSTTSSLDAIEELLSTIQTNLNTHIQDEDKHREINDTSHSLTDLLSASEIDDRIDDKNISGISPIYSTGSNIGIHLSDDFLLQSGSLNLANPSLINQTGTNLIPNDLDLNFNLGGAAENNGGKGCLNLIRNTVPTDAPYQGVSLYAKGVPQSNLVFFCNFNGTNGSTSATDESSNAATITFNGTACLDTSEKKWGTASLYLPSDPYAWVEIDWHDDMDFMDDTSDSFTIDFWVKHSSITYDGTFQYYITFGNGSDNRINLTAWKGTRFYFFTKDGGSTEVNLTSCSQYINDTNWHRVSLIKNGNVIAWYLDNYQVSYDTFSDLLDLSALTGNKMYIGSAPGFQTDFHAHFDTVRLFKSNVFGANPVSGLTDSLTTITSEPTADMLSELVVKNEEGDETTLSPHNFEGIPEEIIKAYIDAGYRPWVYHSKNIYTGEEMTVDLLGMALTLEDKYPHKQFVYRKQNNPIALPNGRKVSKFLKYKLNPSQQLKEVTAIKKTIKEGN